MYVALAALSTMPGCKVIKDEGPKGLCSFNLKAYFPEADYVCDRASKRLKHDRSSDHTRWEWASPKQGSGCHEYAAYLGPTPAGCRIGKKCKACANPAGEHLKSVYFEWSYDRDLGCGMCGPEYKWDTEAKRREKREEELRKREEEAEANW